MSLKTIANTILNILFRIGALEILRRTNRRQLTILNYHRIEYTNPETLAESFEPNISASPQAFNQQMGYLAKHYNIISNEQLLAWILNNEPLPDFPAMITFDDGYLDNFTSAFPVLQRHRLPSLIFLTSGYIGKSEGFFWDVSAYCFAHTKKQYADLPMLGKRSWENATTARSVLNEWIGALKRVNEVDKQFTMTKLPSILDVTIPENAFENIMMSWEQIRDLHSQGISFGAHTVSHPILTRIPLEHAGREIRDSKRQIERELGDRVHSFAYPNGQKDDFTPAIKTLVQQAGFETAFSLIAGSSPLDEVRQNPYSIRRIFISHADTLPRFAAKLAGVSRLRSKAQSY